MSAAVVPHTGKHNAVAQCKQRDAFGCYLASHNAGQWHAAGAVRQVAVQQVQCGRLLCREAHICVVQLSAVQGSAMQGILVQLAIYIERHAPDSLLL